MLRRRTVLLVLIDAMQREDGLGRVEANALKVHEDGPSGSDVDNQTLAHDAAEGPPPHLAKNQCLRLDAGLVRRTRDQAF